IGLSLQSQLLFHGQHFYLNGEEVEMNGADQAALKQLADQRRLDAGEYANDLVEQLHLWYLAGYCRFPDFKRR
ncbi:MAG TPA: winged helix domain-containing protein, partial [Methylophilaceae bacterium]|nr:winged helix domain-containing protein [Methylophilaceae bacterium]